MASFLENHNNYQIDIPKTEEDENGIIFYIIEMQLGGIKWKLKHRYSDFYNLHRKLVSDYGVAKDFLPPKKIIRKKCPYFITQRRKALAIYLKVILEYLERALPVELATFLHFHLYEINYLLQELALKYFLQGDSLLSQAEWITMDPLELHAICRRLKEPCPIKTVLDKRKDFSHVLDVCSQSTKLHCKGNDLPIGDSNILPNQLQFDFMSFKALKQLRITNIPLTNITELGSIRGTLQVLHIEKTNISQVSQVLLCDSVHKNPSTQQIWSNLIELNLCENEVTEIDSTVALMPKLKIFNCNQNQLSDIKNLWHLSNLEELYLSSNLFERVDGLHTKLGNLLHLNLSANFLTTLSGFSKLYSLQFLDVSSNQISSLNEVQYIGDLPCLENLRLTGNPLSIIVDYRVKVLEQFGTRANQLCLDNEMPSQTELDTICVLQAIRIVKEGKAPNFDATQNTPLFILNNTSSN